MKPSFFQLTTILALLFMIAFGACQQEPTGEGSNNSPDQNEGDSIVESICWEHQDFHVPPDIVLSWQDNWSEIIANNPDSFGNWPVTFEAGMADFLSDIRFENKYTNFRIYYGMCNETSPAARLILSPMDLNCDARLGNENCLFSFEAEESPVPECISAGCEGSQVSYDDALSWVGLWHSFMDVSTEEDFVRRGGINFEVPLAFNYKVDTFLTKIDTSQDLLVIQPGLMRVSFSDHEDSVNFRFKLIISSKDTLEGAPPIADYLDFATPCPKHCGNTDNPMLNGQN
jgi:hypothetical protein